MQKVSVRGADGGRAILALVREEHGFAYVCPIAKYERVLSGDDEPVVGFPLADVDEIGDDSAQPNA
jgi:hypothetical protein